MTSALEGGEWSALRPGRTLPPGKTRYPLYRRLCGPQGRSGQVRKITPPPGFDPRAAQPVVSRYTDWATWPTTEMNTRNIPCGVGGGGGGHCLEIRVPLLPVKLRVSPGLYLDCFTFKLQTMSFLTANIFLSDFTFVLFHWNILF
jgi:hypothetical protein